MARPTHATPTKKIDLTVPAGAHAILVRMADERRLGSTAAEVARYLILRELDDLARAGVLPKEGPPSA